MTQEQIQTEILRRQKKIAKHQKAIEELRSQCEHYFREVGEVHHERLECENCGQPGEGSYCPDSPNGRHDLEPRDGENFCRHCGKKIWA